MPDKKQLHEDFIKKFANIAAGFAAGAGAAKLMNLLKNKKDTKQAMQDFIRKTEKHKKDFEKKLRGMPEDEREELMKIVNTMR